MHEEPLLLVITLWLSLSAAATILQPILQYLTLANLPLNPFHESSLQYIGKDY
jgi:hypothetical protein